MRPLLMMIFLILPAASATAVPAGIVVHSGRVIVMQAQPAGGEAQVWVADALDNVLRDAQRREDAAQELALEAARAEYESGQIVVRSEGPLRGLAASASALRSEEGATIPAEALRCRFVGYVPVETNTRSTPPEELVAEAPGMFPDPLLEDAQVDVGAGEAQPVWLTLRVPDDAPAGEYRGQVELTWEGGGATVPVGLTVWDFAVPEERHLLFTNWFSAGALARRYGVQAYSEEFWTIFERFVINCAEHRQNMLWVSPQVIGCSVDGEGNWEFDFTVFDRWVEILERHGVADRVEIAALGGHKDGWGSTEFVLHQHWVTDRATGERAQRPAEEVLPHLLPALQEHLRERGWLHKTLIHIGDEPAIHNLESWRRKSDYVRSLAPEIARIEAIEAPDFGDSLEVWVPKLNHFHNWRASYERARERSAEFWFYTCLHPMGRYPNRFIDYPLIKTRILHWLNWRFDLTGYLHWGLNFWNDDPWTSTVRGHLPAGDAWIVYPGPEGPVDSVRWESLRDGIEDYEYLWVLADEAARVKAELGAAAEGFDPRQLADDLCHEAVQTVVEYVREPAVLREIRRRIAEEIIALREPPLALVWTDPPARETLLGPPAGGVVYVAAPPGATVTVDGEQVELDGDGLYAGRVGVTVGERRIVAEVSHERRTKTITRVLSGAQ